jgi:hypothetical protein
MVADDKVPTILASGYPIFPYQQRALDALPPQMIGRGIARVEHTITPEELYTNYIAKGKPVYGARFRQKFTLEAAIGPTPARSA